MTMHAVECNQPPEFHARAALQHIHAAYSQVDCAKNLASANLAHRLAGLAVDLTHLLDRIKAIEILSDPSVPPEQP